MSIVVESLESQKIPRARVAYSAVGPALETLLNPGHKVVEAPHGSDVWKNISFFVKVGKTCNCNLTRALSREYQ